MSADVYSLIIHVKQVGIVELIFELPADLTILGGIRAGKYFKLFFSKVQIIHIEYHSREKSIGGTLDICHFCYGARLQAKLLKNQSD